MGCEGRAPTGLFFGLLGKCHCDGGGGGVGDGV